MTMIDGDDINHLATTTWLTGLSGAGKTTLANAAASLCRQAGYSVCIIDGDQLRLGLCQDLGFDISGRSENVRRAAEMARLLNEQGIFVLVAMISPLKAQRAAARDVIGSPRFAEVHVKADLGTCERRDPKGLYARVRQGRINQFTGVSSAYEVPMAPDLVLDTTLITVAEGAARLKSMLLSRHAAELVP